MERSFVIQSNARFSNDHHRFNSAWSQLEVTYGRGTWIHTLKQISGTFKILLKSAKANYPPPPPPPPPPIRHYSTPLESLFGEALLPLLLLPFLVAGLHLNESLVGIVSNRARQHHRHLQTIPPDTINRPQNNIQLSRGGEKEYTAPRALNTFHLSLFLHFDDVAKEGRSRGRERGKKLTKQCKTEKPNQAEFHLISIKRTLFYSRTLMVLREGEMERDCCSSPR